MKSKDHLNEIDMQQMSAAWARLEKQLRVTEQSPLWQKWEEQGSINHAEHSIKAEVSVTSVPVKSDYSTASQVQANTVPLGRARVSSTEAVSKSAQRGAVSSWLRRNVGKTIAACAAAIITVVIAIPSTNEALAAWLNTFRMDNVMVVQEDDLETLMYSFLDEGETRETINRFGSFNLTSEGKSEAITVEQAAETLGFPVRVLTIAEAQKVEVYAIPSQSYAFRLHVEKINGAMLKLGADKLLPESVNGKDIVFNAGGGVRVFYKPKEDSASDKHVYVTYSKQPTIDVDPTVNVKDAYDAVVGFPALPNHLRESLDKASSLEKGKIPMPYITNDKVEKIVIKGVDVYVGQRNHNDNKYAIWLQDGFVTEASFDNYSDEQEIQSLIAELIGS